MTFLMYWDEANRIAREEGLPVFMRIDKYSVLYMTTRAMRGSNVTPEGMSARTMHPAFMAPPMPKHDPERDQ